MTKYKILKMFRDVKENRLCGVNDIVSFTPERANEIKSKLGEGYIELVEVKKATSKPKKAK